MTSFLIAVFLVIGQLLTYKNGATATDVVELYVAIDQRVIADYMNHGSTVEEAENHARVDAEFFLREVNIIFQSSGLDIEVHIRQMDVLGEDVFSDCMLRDGNSIHESLGLQTFESYVKDQGLYSSLNYDMALLWTGYNIYGSSDSVAGFATVGTICEENAISIVEYTGTYRTVHVTAHEIGHVLGLNHDEGDCDNGYIMAAKLDTSNERWTFSSCSLSSLSALIPSMACITDTNALSQVPDQAARETLLDANDLCRRARNNTNSYMCKSANLYGDKEPQGDIVCQRIYCYNNDDGYCYSAHPTNGMACGVDERCSVGECATAPDDFPTPSGVEADCLFGDSVVLKLSGGLVTTCTDFFALTSNRFQCYSSTIEMACCETCASLRGDIPGCSYGDRSSQCVHYPKDSVCPAYQDSLCCEYCSDWSGKRSADDNQNVPALKATNAGNAMPEEKETENDVEEGPNTAE